MNDENKVPVPDEAQASPAHAEDDIATLEQEARAKREAELLNAQDDEEKDPVQPAVNKLKKRKRGKATAFLAIVAVALIFLAWGGNWVYRNILWQPTEEKKQDTTPQTNKTDYRQRNDLGMSTDTAEEEPEQQDNGQNSAAGTGQAAPAAPPELNKASFLIRRDGSATTQNPVKTRQQEMTLTSAPHQAYIDAGFYNRVTGEEKTETHDEELIALYNTKNIPLFMEKCVEYGKTLAVAGETSTGKTTYMKMLIGYIPVHLRISTIEDNPEITFFIHKNYVHLFYPSESSDEKGSIVTPASLLRWNYRMNPDRILLTEVRGAEAWDFLKITGSGHEGSMTSIHAGSAKEAIDGFITRCYENPQCAQLPYTFMLRKVLDSLDVIVSIDLDGNVRRMNDIYFRPIHRNQYFEEMKA